MALEFTHIPDRQGPAVYVIGGSMLENRLQTWCDQLKATTSTTTQIIYVDFNSEDGARIAQFYEFTPEKLPVIMIIMDDDTMLKDWYGMDLPPTDMVAYELRQITGGQA